MEYRRYTDADYDMICAWFSALDWPIIPKESIPQYGIIILDDGKCPVASSFIYLVDEKNCDFIYPGWILFNPDISYRKILESMDCISSAYDDIARDNGKTHIQMTMKTESLINCLCVKHGYHKAEINVTRMIKYLDKTKKKEGIFWYDQEGIDQHFPYSPYATPQDE